MNTKKVRLVFIRCVKFSKEIIDTLFTSDCIQIVGIITKQRSKLKGSESGFPYAEAFLIIKQVDN
tara:strand:+ start:22197 stop:22391 length:195 start_codon:yes stop_codon:yes gene_type:complete